jgi:hypothetical protein
MKINLIKTWMMIDITIMANTNKNKQKNNKNKIIIFCTIRESSGGNTVHLVYTTSIHQTMS